MTSPQVDEQAMDYQSFFELSGEMMATGDFAGHFTALNDSFERVLGYADDELIDRPIIEFVHPDDRATTQAELDELAAGHRRVGFENLFRHRDGTYRWLRWSATPSLAEGRFYAVALDMTEVRAKDEALRKVATDLERSNEELSQFAYVASHDLSEPLRVVAGHVELLAHRYEGQLDEDADRYIAFAVEGCTRMRTLIDDLLAFSRAGREIEADDEVELDAVAADVLVSLDELIHDAGAIVAVGDLPNVIGSRSQLEQVLTNLVSNALKFHAEGATPHVVISADRDGRGWRIVVEDDGIGIEPQYRDRIFRIFQRLHGTADYPGTGIGLAICRKMVELRGGRIWCVAAQPQGTRFCFTVPDRGIGRS